jgi:hypothetical protein
MRIVDGGDSSVGCGHTGGADWPGTRVAVGDGVTDGVYVANGFGVDVGVTVGYVVSTAPIRRPRGLTAVIVGPPTTLNT